MSAKQRSRPVTHRKHSQHAHNGPAQTNPVETSDAQLGKAIECIALGDDSLPEVASGLGCSVAELAAMLFDSDSDGCHRAQRALDALMRLMDLHRRCVVERLGLSALRRLGELIATPLDADPAVARVRQFESLRRACTDLLRRADAESAERDAHAKRESRSNRTRSISPHIHAAESARKMASTILRTPPPPPITLAGPSIDDVTTLSALMSDIDAGPHDSFRPARE